jgi:uncharacterized protein
VHRGQRYYDARMRARLVALFALLLVASGCGDGGPQRIVTVSLTNGSAKLEIEAEVASTPEQRTTGLSGRVSLREGAGMLFLYATPVKTGFWMKDTLIPLDIAFIHDGFVAEIHTMTPCTREPCLLTTPAAAYTSTLEVNAGVFDRAGITVGSTVAIEERLPTPV